MAGKKGDTISRHEPEFKKEIVHLVLEEGHTITSVNKDFHLGEGTVGGWSKQFREECADNPQAKDLSELYEENRRLR